MLTLTYDNGSTVFIVQNIAELKGVRVVAVPQRHLAQ